MFLFKFSEFLLLTHLILSTRNGRVVLIYVGLSQQEHNTPVEKTSDVHIFTSELWRNLLVVFTSEVLKSF